MDEQVEPLICSNPACKVSKTGRCVEDNALDQCPFIDKKADASSDEQRSEPETSDDPAAEAHSSPARPESLRAEIHSGDHLSPAEASQLMWEQAATLVAVLGPAHAGKTSLIAEVFDGFQYAQYRQFAFAGSWSLFAFERICHDVRADSMADDVQRERTMVRDAPFIFHIAVKRASDAVARHLLLADRAGDIHSEIANVPASARRCIELRRASILNVLVDGEKLINPINRSSALSDCRRMLFGLVHSGAELSAHTVNLVLTKLDLVEASPMKERALDDFEKLKVDVADRCGGIFSNIEAFRIAACPPGNGFKKGHGIEALVASWFVDPNPVCFAPKPPRTVRSIDHSWIIEEEA